MDQQAQDVRRKLANLYQRWGKVHKIPDHEDISAQACNEPKRQTGSPGSFNTRISLGKRILSQEWHMIQRTFWTAMFRLLSNCTSFFTSRFQKRQMGVGTSELPQSHCGGSTNTFPKYGRWKASQRAWKMATNGTSTARRGAISE
jgi:hypothetical protein